MFAILFEVLLIEIQEEIHHFAGWEGVFKGHKHFVKKRAFLRLDQLGKCRVRGLVAKRPFCCSSIGSCLGSLWEE